jgi:hypothetical protein
MLIEITNYPLLRAVSLCRYTGDDKDTWKEIRGIFFEPSKGLAIATDGKRLFAPEQAAKLGAKAGKVLDRLADVALRLSGMTPAEVEAAEGNSESGQS